jgi:hypothetical protein
MAGEGTSFDHGNDGDCKLVQSGLSNLCTQSITAPQLSTMRFMGCSHEQIIDFLQFVQLMQAPLLEEVSMRGYNNSDPAEVILRFSRYAPTPLGFLGRLGPSIEHIELHVKLHKKQKHNPHDEEDYDPLALNVLGHPFIFKVKTISLIFTLTQKCVDSAEAVLRFFRLLCECSPVEGRNGGSRPNRTPFLESLLVTLGYLDVPFEQFTTIPTTLESEMKFVKMTRQKECGSPFVDALLVSIFATSSRSS